MHEETLFHRALEMPAAERAVFLDQACAGDIALRQRLDALLEAYQKPGSFLAKPALDLGVTAESHPAADNKGVQEPLNTKTIQAELLAEAPGTVIGKYKLLQQIGEGGMGTVYMAEQTEPVRRRVAIKLIKEGMDSRQIIARFEAERQALALMDHPNIAKVFEAGTIGSEPRVLVTGPPQPLTDVRGSGRPYFVMELVKGVPITKYCDEHRLTPRQRLELFVPVCQAVQHAHQKGIIHRDLKPSNVLVAQYDGKPVPKVIDFGVAKAAGPKFTDMTLFTELGAVVGTFEYMSPEQAELNQLDVDTRSDIYSLGVLLYELLTGTTPLERKRIKQVALLEVLRLIREEESPKLSTRLSSTEALPSIAANRSLEPKKLSGLMRGELDWIVHKALEKDRDRRYETANGMAHDIERYLNDEAVQACPPSAAYRIRKFARRNRAAFWTTGVVALALIVGTAVSAWQAVRATKAEGLAQERLETATANYDEAEEQRQAAKTQEGLANEQRKMAVANEKTAKQQALLARRRLYASQVNLALQASEKGDPARVLELLENQRPRFDQEDLRTFEWYYLWQLCHHQRRFTLRHPGALSVAVSPDGKMLASANKHGAVMVWDLESKRELVGLGDQGYLRGSCVAFSADSKTLAAGAENGRVRLWDVGTWREKATFQGGAAGVRSLAFSPDGKILAAGTSTAYNGDGFVKLWNLATGQERATLLGHLNPVLSVAFSPDSRKLASASSWYDIKVKMWDLTTETPLVTHEWDATGPVAFFPDGKTLAVGSQGPVYLLDVATGEQRGEIFLTLPDPSLAISPDGKTLAMGSEDRTLQLWDRASGRRWAMAHVKPVTSVVYAPDGKTVISASGDEITLWDVGQQRPEITLGTRGSIYATVAYSPDHKTLAYSDSGGVVRICDPATGEERATLQALSEDIRNITFSHDSKRLAVGAAAGARVWDITTMRELGTFNSCSPNYQIMTLAPDGQTLALGGSTFNKGNDLTVWDIDAKQVRTILKHDSMISVAIFSPDGKSLVTVHKRDKLNVIQFWNAKTLAKEREVRVPAMGWLNALAFSPDGKTLVASEGSGGLRSLDVETGRMLAAFKGHTGPIWSLAFFPDGKTLISGSYDGTAKLWDPSTGQERFSLLAHEGHYVTCVRIAPDGKTIATGGCQATAKLWRAADAKEAVAKKTELDADDPESPAALIIEGERLRTSGQVDAAAEAYRKAAGRLSELSAVFPKVPEYRLQLAHSRNGLGHILWNERKTQEGEKECREAVDLFEKLAAEFPNDAQYQVHVANCLTQLAGFFASNNQPLLAEECYRQALSNWEKLVSNSPPSQDHRQHLMWTQNSLVKFLEAAGRTLDAVQVFRHIIVFYADLATANPNVIYYRVSLAQHFWNQAEFLKNTGQRGEADKAYGEAEQNFRQVLDQKWQVETPGESVVQTHQKFCRFALANILVSRRRWREGEQFYVNLIQQEPKDPLYPNNLAWLLATCPDVQFRDSKRSVELAKKAVELAPNDGNDWNTLGVTHYRNNDWHAAIAALEKSVELRKGGDANDWFFMAMAHGQLGHKDEARKWFDQAVHWMEKNAPKNEELIRFRAEAEKLLDVKERK